jgi:formylglycine-generating enzyme required for sulfatase activity
MKHGKWMLIALIFALAAGVIGIQYAYQQYLVSRHYAEPEDRMVLVPAGYFLMGSDSAEADDDERPRRRVFLPAFYIDIYEVTNAEFSAFDAAHTYRDGEGDFPVTGITLQRARDYAASIGKRLPTRAEWEKAARGTDGRDYTWGSEFRPGLENMGSGKNLAPVGSHPESVSPYGAHDMIGNAWEWVEDIHRDEGWFWSGRSASEHEVIKGGAYSYGTYQCRASYNGFEGIGSTCNDVGFRCVQDARLAADS